MNLLVTSPMRVGSTWVHELLIALLKPQRTNFVRTPDEALAAVSGGMSCVLKSHSIIDLDLPALQGRIHTVRVLRNYKDCLISRALYCRNVRTAEGEENTPAEQEVIDRCKGMETREFVNVYLSEFRELQRWVGDLVMFERGEFDHTFYYEMLLHNMHDEMWNWVCEAGLEHRVSQADVVLALKNCSFQRMQKRTTKGFVGSTGVGQWMHWLDEPLIDRLDALYLEQRERFFNHPTLRHPNHEVARPVPEAAEKIPLFCGGIGDVFLQCCTTDRYRILSEPDGPATVVNASRNEYADELFRWHPNAKHFRVLRKVQPADFDLPAKKAFYTDLGLAESSLYEGGKKKAIDWDTAFYPGPHETDKLADLQGRRFGLFAPFSKPDKTLPAPLCLEMLPQLRALLGDRMSLYGIGRNYKTVNKAEQDLSVYADEGWLLDLSSENLSVPATFTLARSAEFYVGANSCLALVTLSRQRPTVILEPPNHTNPVFWPKLFNLESCLLIQKIDAVDWDRVAEFLSERIDFAQKQCSSPLLSTPVKKPRRSRHKNSADAGA